MPATNQLRVQNGDTITATYFDASINSNVTATAGIDTVPPVISQVAATTDYSNAQVTWLTSKPADSSVQYGESSCRTSFLREHARHQSLGHCQRAFGEPDLLLSGRQPRPGRNIAVDDNNGNLFTFQTLKAPTPPWFDNLESGAPGWTVVPTLIMVPMSIGHWVRLTTASRTARIRGRTRGGAISTASRLISWPAAFSTAR